MHASRLSQHRCIGRLLHLSRGLHRRAHALVGGVLRLPICRCAATSEPLRRQGDRRHR